LNAGREGEASNPILKPQGDLIIKLQEGPVPDLSLGFELEAFRELELSQKLNYIKPMPEPADHASETEAKHSRSLGRYVGE
jgi:hypothetical protein